MIYRIYVEKKRSVSTVADALRDELNSQLRESISSMRCFLRYDIEGLERDELEAALGTVFSEPPVDDVFLENLPDLAGYSVFAVEYLPGQYDLRADSAAQCVQLLTRGIRPEVRCAVVYALSGSSNLAKIQSYLVNPVDSRIAPNEKPSSLAQSLLPPEPVPIIERFRFFSPAQLLAFHTAYALAMSMDDLQFVRDYFADEGRDPTEAEIKVLDTYWSDHCRHTTFLTELASIHFDTEIPEIAAAYAEYQQLFKKHYAERSDKYECLMDMATMGMRELKSRGLLPDLDESEEINACSIKVTAETSAGLKDYLVLFKNETHNHPTEIEPFGGAATGLGGAIRDPLSGRAYVYQAMRVTGAADVTASASATLPGKLPQRVISKEAARGFSSYGNQIGLATGIVAEVYHPDYVAKRLEVGFVVGAAPAEQVVRLQPETGDIVLLIGGATGRDGIGGATGSSKEQSADSIETSGAEVQKGNPITERKIQRLFRNPECSRLIKRCNDFGAGGVCVAIGELSEGLLINLDAVPKKYEGLNGVELAISESQERMAVVIAPWDLEKMQELCAAENVQATPVAAITDSNRMIMHFGGQEIVNLKRTLLSSNGVKQTASAALTDKMPSYMNSASKEATAFLLDGQYALALESELKRLNVASNKGMSELFDSTIGAGSVFMPFGGSKQLTPAIAMAAKLPVYPLETDTATVASWGFDPYLMSESPFVGAQYSVLLSVAKVCAAGAPYHSIYLTLQEYFKKLWADPERWGQPVSALLGALTAQLKLGLGAIGGKDSMSGSFLDLDVPSTLISFAITVANASDLIANVLHEGAEVYRIAIPRSATGCPDFGFFRNLMEFLHTRIKEKHIDFCTVIEAGGAAAAIAKACLGNGIGFRFEYCQEDLFYPRLGDILIAGGGSSVFSDFAEFSPQRMGYASGSYFTFNGKDSTVLSVESAEKAYCATLATVFPLSADEAKGVIGADFHSKTFMPYTGPKFTAPRVLIPVFPGTNCEYDTAKKFLGAGARVDFFIFKNLSAQDIKESAATLAAHIRNSQIIAIPGGFSGGDEPDGSAKFIATAFRSPEVADAVAELVEIRKGLILGICNGFQALIKLGLLPFGVIAPMTNNSATLYYNTIGRHVSTLCNVRVASTDSPWLSNVKVGDVFKTAISHGEGRLIASDEMLATLKNSGRICTQYVDSENQPTGKMPYNPNGSLLAIEGLLSPCGRILGKMGHIERAGAGLFKNVPGESGMDIFSAGVSYFA